MLLFTSVLIFDIKSVVLKLLIFKFLFLLLFTITESLLLKVLSILISSLHTFLTDDTGEYFNNGEVITLLNEWLGGANGDDDDDDDDTAVLYD